MTTADYALIVSLFSAVIALLSFGWNIWQKFLYPKARLRVSFHTCVVTIGNGPPYPRFIALSGTNHGPTDVSIQHVFIKYQQGLFKRQYAMVNPIHHLNAPEVGIGPFAGGLPKTLKVGEQHTSYFPHNAQSFARDRLTMVGFHDNFGRSHKVPKRYIRKIKAELDTTFAAEPYMNPIDDQANEQRER